MKQLTYSAKCLLLLSMNLLAYNCFSQLPTIAWQNDIGGTNSDGCYSLAKTYDGGYILGGYSYSVIGGDKTETSRGLADYWIAKLDVEGNLEWEKTYGGSGYDFLNKIIQTSDHGYLLGGNSSSPISGDKTENVHGAGALYDFWVIKIDSVGNIEWQNTIGGNNYDQLYSLDETEDGGYILGGHSSSGISGDKTEPRIGLTYDYWIVKLDATGNIVWQNTIGGTGPDYCEAVGQTIDNGYLVIGYTNSGISGDKTEALTGGSSDYDVWVVKLDEGGSIVWQNNIGGSLTDGVFDAVITETGGAVIACQSISGISGDKTEDKINTGSTDYDYWVFEIDATGNIIWQNTIGGLGEDYVTSVAIDPNGERIIGGYSESEINGDKSEGHYGMFDYWVLKLDTTGNILWQKTIGGTGPDYLYAICDAGNGGIAATGQSSSDISGNKTEPTVGFADYWVVQIDPPCVPLTEICNGIDDDCNSIIDDGVVESISISTSGATTFCQGGSVALTATYSGTSVQWYKNGVSISGATSPTYIATAKATYTCTSMSSCDTVTSSGIFIDVLKKPKAIITAGGPTTFCAGSSVTLSVTPVAGCTYQWYDGTTIISGATGTSYIATTAGNYKCLVTKTSTGCTKYSNSILIVISCKEATEHDAIKLFPNPANDFIIIETNTDSKNEILVNIFSANGDKIKTVQVFSHEQTDIKDLSSGYYTIQVISDDIIKTFDLVKME